MSKPEAEKEWDRIYARYKARAKITQLSVRRKVLIAELERCGQELQKARSDLSKLQ